jgi:hypothetical protein
VRFKKNGFRDNLKLIMKESRSTNNRQSKQGMSHKPRPEIRDDMDSRKGKANTGNDKGKNKKKAKKN